MNKFIPKNKMSKKAQKELNKKDRGDWGTVRPCSQVFKSKKTYSRKNQDWKKVCCY